MKFNKLLIVSDTQIHFGQGEYHAFNSVVKELDVFFKIFTSITWIGYNFSDKPIDDTLLKISHPNVRVVLLPRTGGKTFLAKLIICKNVFLYAHTILREARKVDMVHSRGPSVPMLIALCLSFFYKKPRWWFKYANNWSDPRPPLFWKLQKKLMCKNTLSVGTINGKWDGLPSHIFPFENPCLEGEISKSKVLVPQTGWRLLFVGRLEEKKGLSFIIDALEYLPFHKIESLTFIGNGEYCNELKVIAEKYKGKLKIIIEGFKPKSYVFEKMYNSDFILLPSMSEGFPKVIAEAWYNGCIPVVSSVSCIDQYVVKGVNGFLWTNPSEKFFWQTLCEALNISDKEYQSLIMNGYDMCSGFTYNYYEKMIRTKLLV